MKTELLVLAGQRERVIRRKREQIQTLNFFLYFLVVQTCLFTGFIFTGSRLVCRPHQNGGRNFRLFLHFCGWCSTDVFASSCSAANLLSKPSLPLLFHGSRGRNISVSAGSTPAQKIGDLWLFLVLLITVLSMSAFSSYIFSSFSPCSEINLYYSLWLEPTISRYTVPTTITVTLSMLIYIYT